MPIESHILATLNDDASTPNANVRLNASNAVVAILDAGTRRPTRINEFTVARSSSEPHDGQNATTNARTIH